MQKADLEAAEVLVRAGKTSYSYQLAVLHCHQAIEKILKTIIVDNGELPNPDFFIRRLIQDIPTRRANTIWKRQESCFRG